MYDLILGLANVLPLYRAAQDAGIWFFQMDRAERENYMESYFIAKGLL